MTEGQMHKRTSENFPLIIIGLVTVLALAFHSIYEDLLKAILLKQLGGFMGISGAELASRLTEMTIPILGAVAVVWILYRYISNQFEKAFADLTTPNVKVFLDPDTNGVIETPTFKLAGLMSGHAQRTPGPRSKFVQLSVECTSLKPAVDCEVWLTSVRRVEDTGALGTNLVEEQINCTWSQLEATKITLQPKRIQRANLFSLYSDGRRIQPWTNPVKILLDEGIQTPGKFQIGVLVTALGGQSVERSYVFYWKDFSKVSIAPL